MKWKDIIINTIISAMIGAVVGVIAIIANPNINIPKVLFVNGIIGIIIGCISERVYYYVYEVKRKGIKVTLLAIFAVIFVIVLGLGATNGIRNFPWEMFLIVLPIVEFLTFVYVYSNYRASIKYNKKLKDKKKQFMNK